MCYRTIIPLILSLSFLSFACDEKIEPGSTPKPPPVIRGLSVDSAKMVEKPMIYEAVGTVTAGIKSVLSSKILGVIEEIRVREGDHVKKGDVLALIDPRQVEAGKEKAEAALSEAKKALNAAISARDAARTSKELAYATYERYRQLKRENMISAQVFDETEARFRQSEAELRRSEALVEAAKDRVKQAAAALSEAKVARKDALITAPHDGVIAGKMADKGDLASPGVPILTLETTRGFCVDAVVPETYVHFVSPMQNVKIRIPAMDVAPVTGTVCTIVPSADPKSRSFLVKINIPTDMGVRSGIFARVEIPAGRSLKLLLPLGAVVERGQLNGIYLVDDQRIVHFRLIRVGKRFGDTVEVLSGLKEGDRYVLNPGAKIEDGARLETSS